MSMAQRIAPTALENASMLAGRSDLASAVLGRRAPQLGEALSAHGVRRLVAPALEQRGRSDEVCEQDRDE